MLIYDFGEKIWRQQQSVCLQYVVICNFLSLSDYFPIRYVDPICTGLVTLAVHQFTSDKSPYLYVWPHLVHVWSWYHCYTWSVKHGYHTTVHHTNLAMCSDKSFGISFYQLYLDRYLLSLTSFETCKYFHGFFYLSIKICFFWCSIPPSGNIL